MNSAVEQKQTDLSEFDALKAQVTLFVQPTSQIVVTDAASNSVALGTIRSIKDFKAQIEDRRKAATTPLRERVAEINTYAEEITAPLVAAQSEIEQKMLKYKAEQKRIADEEQRKIELRRKEAEEAARQKRLQEEQRVREQAEADAKALRERQEADRKALEKKLAEEAAVKKLFTPTIDPAVEKAKADEAARQLAQHQADEKAAADRKAEAARLANQAKLDREAKQMERSFKAESKAVAASAPKNTTKVPRYKIVQPDLVPDEFWVIDEAKLFAAVKSGQKEIPGVDAWMEDVIAVRG